MLKNIKRKIVFSVIFLLAVSVVNVMFAIDSPKLNALSDNWSVYEYGEKSVKGSRIETGFTGTIKNTLYVFKADAQVWKGDSGSYWMGINPWDADSITHADIIGVGGIGSASFGYPSGVSVTTSGKTATYTYSAQNCWYVNVDYSYMCSIGTCFSMSQRSSGTFKFGSSFYVVDSTADNYISEKSYWIS
jgi:hypothetical protein